MSKTIKIIDVINKIAKGEIPKAIKYHNKIYSYVKNEDEEGYLNADFGGDWLINIIHWDDIKELNQEVEIIEEIDKLEIDDNGFIHTNNGNWKGRKLDVAFAESINKLTEAIKNIKEKQ